MPKQRSITAPEIRQGKRIRALRMAKGMSQADLGETLGVSFQQVQKYEKGVNRVSTGRAQQIAKALGVPVLQIIDPDAAGETITPSVLTLMSSNDGAKLARAFNDIDDPNLRQAVLDLARMLAATSAVNSVSFARAAR